MTRALHADFLAEIEARGLVPVFMCELDFPTGVKRVWTGVGDLSWNGQTWEGVGEFGRISPIKELEGKGAPAIEIGLAGIDPDTLSDVTEDDFHMRDANLYFGTLDQVTNATIADPILLYAGRMDHTRILMGGETATITVIIESEKSYDNEVNTFWGSEEMNKVDHPTDSFFNHVVRTLQKEKPWGVDGSGSMLPSSGTWVNLPDGSSVRLPGGFNFI